MLVVLLLVELMGSQLPLLQERHSHLYWFILSRINKHHTPLAALSPHKGSEFLLKAWPLQSFLTHTFLKRIQSAYGWCQRKVWPVDYPQGAHRKSAAVPSSHPLRKRRMLSGSYTEVPGMTSKGRGEGKGAWHGWMGSLRCWTRLLTSVLLHTRLIGGGM